MDGRAGIGIAAIALGAVAVPAPGPSSPRHLPAVSSRSASSLPDPLVFCSETDNPPMSQIGVPPGFDVEVAEALGRRLGVRTRIVWLRPHADVLEVALEEGRCTAAPGVLVTDGPTMAGSAPAGVVTTRPYYSAGYVLVRRRDGPPAATLEEVRERRIAVESVSIAAYTLRQGGYTVHVFPDAAGVIEAVAERGEDFGYLWEPLAAWLLRDRDDVIVEETFEPVERWSFGLAVRETDGALRSALDGAIAGVAREGTLDAIFARYGIARGPRAP
ncbi:MAG: substrate-binding periplasmic protein [Gemmatimonadota bacterium]